MEKPDGSKECLHPLSMEGFCVEGLLDYQFCQTSKTSFEMLAEAGESAERVKESGLWSISRRTSIRGKKL